MREIKFRGLIDMTDSIQWQFGDLFNATTGVTIVSNGGADMKDFRFVKPETVGQFTGLKDKNGVEIYVGDIARVNGDDEYKHCKPKFGEHVGIFVIEEERGYWGYEISWTPKSGYDCSTHIMGDIDEETLRMKNVEVLGDIHSNPELL